MRCPGNVAATGEDGRLWQGARRLHGAHQPARVAHRRRPRVVAMRMLQWGVRPAALQRAPTSASRRPAQLRRQRAPFRGTLQKCTYH